MEHTTDNSQSDNIMEVENLDHNVEPAANLELNCNIDQTSNTNHNSQARIPDTQQPTTTESNTSNADNAEEEHITRTSHYIKSLKTHIDHIIAGKPSIFVAIETDIADASWLRPRPMPLQADIALISLTPHPSPTMEWRSKAGAS